MRAHLGDAKHHETLPIYRSKLTSSRFAPVLTAQLTVAAPVGAERSLGASGIESDHSASQFRAGFST
jgi:hypothetical protein